MFAGSRVSGGAASKPALSEAERDRRGFDCSLTNDRQLITRDTLDAPKCQILRFDPVAKLKAEKEQKARAAVPQF